MRIKRMMRILKVSVLSPDKEGFDPQKYPGIKDETYDLLPMIKEAIAIKNNQEDNELRIIASAWTAPWWMKDIEEWYIPDHLKITGRVPEDH